MTYSSSCLPGTTTGEALPIRKKSASMHRLAGLAAAILLPLTLTACGDEDNVSFAPTCPLMHVSPELGDYYNYSAKGPTFDHLVTRAEITHVGGECLPYQADKKKTGLRTRVGIHMIVHRGPASKSDSLVLPWFVAVVHDDKIVGKHIFEQTVTFPAGVTSVAVDTRLVTVDLPIRPTNGQNEYQFEVGFQLTKTQLAYNREHGVNATFTGQ